MSNVLRALLPTAILGLLAACASPPLREPGPAGATVQLVTSEELASFSMTVWPARSTSARAHRIAIGLDVEQQAGLQRTANRHGQGGFEGFRRIPRQALRQP